MSSGQSGVHLTVGAARVTAARSAKLDKPRPDRSDDGNLLG